MPRQIFDIIGLMRYKLRHQKGWPDFLIKVSNIERCATHETHSYEDEMEETVNLAELESAEIFGGEVI